MNVGDIEANFMFFIYSDIETSEGNRGNSSLIPTSSVSSERKFRNTNLERIESAKLSKGSTSLEGQMKSVGFDELGDFFNLEKVSE